MTFPLQHQWATSRIIGTWFSENEKGQNCGSSVSNLDVWLMGLRDSPSQGPWLVPVPVQLGGSCALRVRLFRSGGGRPLPGRTRWKCETDSNCLSQVPYDGAPSAWLAAPHAFGGGPGLSAGGPLEKKIKNLFSQSLTKSHPCPGGTRQHTRAEA